MWKLFVLFTLTFASGDDFFSRNEYKRTQLGNAVDKASMRLLKDLYEESTDKNVISSPLGVLMLLSLYSTGASETNREQIVKLLGLPDYKQVTNSYSLLSEKFNSMNPDLLTLANKVYVSNRYALNDHFSTVATRDYYSEVGTLNFTDSQAAAAAINEWADRKTRGNIKNPVSADIFTPDTAAALFNVIFFRGHWGVPFRKADTKEKKFYISKSETTEKPTMHLLQSLLYKEDKDLGARMIELPYKEAGFRMIVVLPDAVDGLPGVLEKLSQRGILEDVFALSPAGQDVYLDMPKFDVKSKFNLKNILNKEGVGGIFSEEAPGVVKGQGVKVSEVFQEAFVKVDEEGATAGAFTGVLFVATSALLEPPQPLQFKVDRPFLYVILNEDIVLFAGTYSH